MLLNAPLDQIGSFASCRAQRGVAAPARDFLMVAGKKNFRRLAPAPNAGPSVLRKIQKTVRERFLRHGLLVFQHPGNFPRDGVGDRERGQLSARQNKISEGNFLVEKSERAFVDAFVVAASQHDVLAARQFLRGGVVEALALRRKKHRPSPALANAFNRLRKRLRHEHHPRPAAKRAVVGFAVLVFAEVGMFESSVSFDVTLMPGLKNMFFGGDGIFIAQLTGPGKIWLQTLTMPNLAHALMPFMGKEAATSPTSIGAAVGSGAGGIGGAVAGGVIGSVLGGLFGDDN